MYEENIMNDTGKINISEEVIAVVAGVASSEVKGVECINTSIVGGISDLLGKKNHAKGVKVLMEEEQVRISVSISVEYGCNIPEVACEVQEKVKREVETMTSLNVTAVDVFVNTIVIPKTEKPASDTKK